MKKDKKYIRLIRAFQEATYAKVISVEPTERYVTIYYKQPNSSIKGGWRYGSVSFPVK